MPCLFLVCFSLILLPPSAFPQSNGQQKFKISGTVVNSVDNQPVRGAMVELFGSTEQKSAMTSADGHFEIDNVAAGSANISAHRPGYDQNQQQKPIKVDENSENISLKLMPLSKISGRLLDAEGEPIEGLLVQCLREQISDGHKHWRPQQAANSDEAGNFLLENLSPGIYLLHTMQKQLYFVRPKSEASRYVYPPTYYPDSLTRNSAQQIVLAPGAETKVDLTLKSTRGNRITLSVVPAGPFVMANIEAEDEGFGGGGQAQVDGAGGLVFPAVPPGNWKIVANGPFRPQNSQNFEPPMHGELEIAVGTADIENLKLPLAKLTDISVTTSGVDQNAQSIVQLVGKNGQSFPLSNSGSPGEVKTELKISGVPPGIYRVVVQSNGGKNCVVSQSSGSQDLLREELVVSAGAQVAPIQIVESATCNQVSVSTGSQEPSTVIVVSENADTAVRNQALISGHAVISGLSDGNYQVFAFDDLTDLEYANPDVMRNFKGESVHLEGGKSVSVQLEVNERHAK